MHGDEYGVIGCIQDYLETQKGKLPAYLYVPEVSPSAVLQQTRRNKFGNDVNRNFFDPPQDPEIKILMEKLLPYHFSLCINFHEDPDLTSTFYLYDSGLLTPDQLLHLRSRIVEDGAGLHTGKDDPLDANLGLFVEKGYISTPYEILPQNAGFSWLWFAKHGITERDIDVEIPGKAPESLKRTLVATIFSFFITPDFGF